MSHTIFIGKNFIELEKIPSTNTYALNLLNVQPPEGTAIRAIHQTQGRGQAGNSWEVKSGQNLTISIILYPKFLAGASIFYLSKMASIAVRNCVAHFLPNEEVLIKWPNDILVNRKKIAGILIENQFEAKHIKGSVIGIGLNVNQQVFPPNIIKTACSLRSFLPKDLDIQEVYHRLFQEIETVYLNLKQNKLPRIDATYFNHLYGYQEEVLLQLEGKTVKKTIVGVDTNGKLAVEWEKNKLRYFDIKEISFLLSEDEH